MGRLVGKLFRRIIDFLSKKIGFSFEFEKETIKLKINFHKD